MIKSLLCSFIAVYSVISSAQSSSPILASRVDLIDSKNFAFDSSDPTYPIYRSTDGQNYTIQCSNDNTFTDFRWTACNFNGTSLSPISLSAPDAGSGNTPYSHSFVWLTRHDLQVPAKLEFDVNVPSLTALDSNTFFFFSFNSPDYAGATNGQQIRFTQPTQHVVLDVPNYQNVHFGFWVDQYVDGHVASSVPAFTLNNIKITYKPAGLSISAISFEQPPGTPAKVDPQTGLAILQPGVQAAAVGALSARGFDPADTRSFNLVLTKNGVYENSYPTQLSWFYNGSLNQQIWFTPQAGDDKSTYTLTIDPDQQFKDDTDRSDNSASGKFEFPSIELTVIQSRLGQTVFSSSNSVDLVTNKKFVGQFNMKVKGSEIALKSAAVVNMYVDGNDLPAASSAPFILNEIKESGSTAMVFSQPLSVGTHSLEFRIEAVDADDPYFTSKETKKIQFTVTEHDISYSIYFENMSGCTKVDFCFKAPLASDTNYVLKTELPLTQQLLPISGNKLTYVQGPNYLGHEFLDIGGGVHLNNIGPDWTHLWTMKVLNKGNVGAYVVSQSFLDKVAPQSDPKFQTTGFYNRKLPGVVFVSSDHEGVLTHELIHALGQDSHAEGMVERVGTGASDEYINHLPYLDSSILNRNLASNVHKETASSSDSALGMAAGQYSAIFRKFMLGPVDPPALVIGGTFDVKTGLSTSLEIQRGMVNLPEAPSSGDVKIEAYDSNGKVVGTVFADSSSEFTAVSSSGEQTIQMPRAIYTGVIVDPGNVAIVKVTKSGKVISVQNVTELTTATLLNRLISSDVRYPILFNAFKRDALALYNDSQLNASKGRKATAQIELGLLKALLLLNLKSEFVLSDGTKVKLADALKTVDLQVKGCK